MNYFRRYFLSGLVVIIPFGLTILIFWFLVTKLGGFLTPIFKILPFLKELPQEILTIFGFILFLLLILLIGALTSGFLGRWFFGLLEDLILKLPLVREVYNSARQLTHAVFVDRKSLKKVVAVEYPRKGIFTIGFIMNEEKIFSQDKKNEFYLIYLPTTPNPTSGWLTLIPAEEVKELNLSIDEGLKLVVSGGIVISKETLERLRL
ncbi:MAG: DUF502 domain-containing protein [candidate division WOR-3 bacterium]|nr:DUF502 domain-containing protein [candidate division WOR-3 bacterium]MCX7837438.1 DUF502 domain-containing protein [candidate division WOR-3 bacterium]MDW8114126.1 DUF502 domain-containing protein [candidate division WOR-3 bacterium]